MIKYLIVAIFFVVLVTKSVLSNATEYITITTDNQYRVLVDEFSTAQQEAKVNTYVKTWCKRNNATTQTQMYYKIRNHISRLATYDNDGKESYTAYGVIYNHRAVCMGYAILAKLMFDVKKIQNELIYDLTANHLYNRACLDGVTRDIDITWYDVGLEKLISIKGGGI